MSQELLTRPVLVKFLRRLDAQVSGGTRFYLVGESSLVLEGWREWTDQIIYALDGADERSVIKRLSKELELPVLHEPPHEIVPLPNGWERRARPWDAADLTRLSVLHFDPYSTAFRLIARGDEPDYFVVIAFLEHGWIELEEMDRKLADLLPQFTAETIQQDPAEFRRKYKGLRQLWKSVSAAA